MNELPLLELFTRLCEAGLPLGVGDYEAVLEALRGGFGLPDRSALARLCRTLWVRSSDEQQLFDLYFKQILGEQRPEITDETEILAILQNVNTENSQLASIGKEVAWRITHSSFRAFGYVVLLSGLSLGFGMGIWSFVSVIRPLPDFSTIVGPATTAQSSPIAIPSSSPQPSTKSTNQLTPDQKVRLNQWKNREELITQAAHTSWLVVGILVAGSFVTGCLWFLRAFLQRPQKSLSPLEQVANTQQSPVLKNRIVPELLREINDEVQAAQTVQQITSQGSKKARDRFVLAGDYLPVTQRQMKQSWRHLRRMVREGSATELDVDGTVQRIAHDGILLEPVLVARRTNRTELILLIDQDGSMVSFHSLSARLAETALRGGRLGKAGIYYFHNCPIGYLYHDPMHYEAEPIEDVFAGLRREHTVVLIFSDAGAARGGLNLERAKLTATFLQQLNQQVRYVAWLNPVPKPRWATSTAREIALQVPMFEANRQGLDAAIDALRGRHQLLEKFVGGKP